MVYQAANAVKLPIIGMGGIANAADALEFILAGATAVAIGTANFHNPYATVETVDGIRAYMERHGIEDIKELIGAVRIRRAFADRRFYRGEAALERRRAWTIRDITYFLYRQINGLRILWGIEDAVKL